MAPLMLPFVEHSRLASESGLRGTFHDLACTAALRAASAPKTSGAFALVARNLVFHYITIRSALGTVTVP